MNHKYVAPPNLIPLPESLEPHVIGERIYQYRTLRRMTYSDLAHLVGVSRTLLSYMERGHIKSPALDMLYRVAIALEVNPLWLIFGDLISIASTVYIPSAGNIPPAGNTPRSDDFLSDGETNET